jgi:hypothetical protein
MKNYIRPSLSFSLALLLTAMPVFAATRGGGNANNAAVRSSSRSNVNQPSHNAASNRSANDNRNTNSNRNTNVNNNTNVNRNTNVNKNTNVNVNRDVNVNTHNSYNNGYYGGGGCCYHSGVGVAAAVATTAVVTAAVVGSRVNTLPPNCTTVVANGVTYQQCGGSYYQPQFSGGNTTYVVVNQP